MRIAALALLFIFAHSGHAVDSQPQLDWQPQVELSGKLTPSSFVRRIQGEPYFLSNADCGFSVSTHEDTARLELRREGDLPIDFWVLKSFYQTSLFQKQYAANNIESFKYPETKDQTSITAKLDFKIDQSSDVTEVMINRTRTLSNPSEQQAMNDHLILSFKGAQLLKVQYQKDQMNVPMEVGVDPLLINLECKISR